VAQKDYVSRRHVAGDRHRLFSRKKRGSTKVSKTVLALATAMLIIFIGGLYFITHNKPNSMPLLPMPNNRQSNNLPPKPEERWQYIKELENRQIGVQTTTKHISGVQVNDKNQLTAEQRKLLEQMQANMQQRPTQLNEMPHNYPSKATARGNSHQQQKAITPRNPFNKGSISKEVQPPIELKPTVNLDRLKQEAKTGSKQKWIVLCGSFRATDQAESVRALLAFEGIESYINTGNSWNHIILGPYSTRATADKTLARLHGVGMSSCINRALGG
jgi:cell division protein FtsN